MDRAEAIKVLTLERAAHRKDGPVERAIDMAITELREKEQREWISVKERLPEHLQTVLTCSAHGNIHIFTHYEGSKYPFDIGPDHHRFYEITHWMPLPEPPKEGADHE